MRPDEYFRNYLTSWRMYQRNLAGKKFEPEAYYMKHMTKPGDTCLHFGASDGRHSYMLSGIVGDQGVVHAYEPSSYSFKIMSRLIRWHGTKNVVPHHAALGADQGRVTLNVPRKLSGHLGRAYAVIGDEARGSEALLAQSEQTNFVREDVECFSLDGVLAAENLDRVDFIRCDVEGAEVLLIKGGDATFKKHLPAILIEIHPFSIEHNFKSDPKAVKDYFLNLGYKMWRLDDEDKELIETTELDDKRRWRDYFLMHPDRVDNLPEGPFKTALTS